MDGEPTYSLNLRVHFRIHGMRVSLFNT